MKVFLDTIGCRLNQSEIERIGSQFRKEGHELVESAQEADLVVVNTCTVTSAAASDSRQKIRQAGRNPRADIVVTGCWATMEPDAASALSGVSHVVKNDAKDSIAALYPGQRLPGYDLEPLARQPLPGLHARTRAFIKAQDGCDNFCTYCITRIARGQSRSQSVQEVLEDIRSAAAGGVKEIVLSGVQLGSWGQEFDPPLHLRELIRIILAETEIPRVRLSSVEPWNLDETFFALWQDPRLCRHFHLPLQSGAAATLKRMVRNTTPEDYRQLVKLIRGMIPQAGITTDILVGFPGETEDDFAESLAFVNEMRFAAGHVFPFSPRAGTAAARMNNQVPPAVRKQRARVMRQALTLSNREFLQRFNGESMMVLWESADALGPDGWQMHGLTDNYIRVTAVSPELRQNQINRVTLVEIDGDGMRARIEKEPKRT